MAQELVRLLEATRLPADAAVKAARHCVAHLSWEAMSAELQALYASLIKAS
jgi:hypothetical protein